MLAISAIGVNNLCSVGLTVLAINLFKLTRPENENLNTYLNVRLPMRPKQAISDNSPLLGGFCLCCNPKEYLLSAERFWRSPLSFGAIVRQCVVGLSVHHCPHESLPLLSYLTCSFPPLYTPYSLLSQHTQSAL